MTHPNPPPSTVDELRALEKAATGAPWCAHPNGTSVWHGPDWDAVNHNPFAPHILNAQAIPVAAALSNIELIVAMRNALPGLLDRLAELEAALKASEEQAGLFMDCPACEQPCKAMPGDPNPQWMDGDMGECQCGARLVVWADGECARFDLIEDDEPTPPAPLEKSDV